MKSPVLNAVELEKQQARAVKDMVATEGWAVIDTKMSDKVNALIVDLLKAKGDDVVILQSDIKAIQTLLGTIKTWTDKQTD